MGIGIDLRLMDEHEGEFTGKNESDQESTENIVFEEITPISDLVDPATETEHY